jgi:uncharacterized protein involved in exopolysaccharide biosynthesis
MRGPVRQRQRPRSGKGGRDSTRPVRQRQLLRLGSIGLAITSLGLLIGYVVGRSGPDVYAARSEVLYEISQERPTGFLREDRSLTTQLALMRSRSVLNSVATSTNMRVEDIESALTVELVGGSSEIIRVEAQDPSSAKALAIVTAVVDRYLTVTKEQGTKDALAYLQEERDRVTADIAGKRSEINQFAAPSPSPGTGTGTATDPRQAAAQAELASLLSRSDSLSTDIDKLTVGQRTQQRIEVLVPAYALADPVGPRPLLATAGAGLTAALIAAFVVAFLGRRRASR